MPHAKQHITDLADICFRKGIARVIISPGSRNAPLIDAFYRRFGEACISLVDERSAAFFGLGFARYTRKPVVLLCSSGSAMLNYAPALAEAYYQQAPVLAVTADRPAAWIDQYDNQTLRQRDIYQNYVKKSFHLPAATASLEDLWFTHRQINEAINTCMSQPMGPVHVNAPLSEPLYTLLPAVSEQIRIVDMASPQSEYLLPDSLSEQWLQAGKILIVHGQHDPCSSVTDPLTRLLTQDSRVTVIAENLSNARNEHIVDNPEVLFAHHPTASLEWPDLLLHAGGQIVSKNLKQFLRNAKIEFCWRIGPEDFLIDTYQQATCIIPVPAGLVYRALCGLSVSNPSAGYGSLWRHASESAKKARDAIVRDLPFSDCTVMRCLLETLPDGTALELGNSSIVRYAQLFDTRRGIDYFSNRGVSGIDGCISAAVGTAAASGRLTVCIVGDLSFVYDSNALWNRDLPSNLRIVVVNNRGGGIFNLLDGRLDSQPHDRFVCAHHPVELQKLTDAFGVSYYCAENESDLLGMLPSFYSSEARASVLEIRTDCEVNTQSFFKVMEALAKPPADDTEVVPPV